MCYYVLKSNGEFIARSTVIPIPDEELESVRIKEQMSAFITKLHTAIGDHDKALVDDKVVFDETL